MSAATAVCLANALRPAVEAARDRASAAESLVDACARQARRFLDPILAEAK
jgi:hypothetical protein